MSKYRYFVFDFDLTLADSSEGIPECFKHVLKEFGYPPKDDRTIYNTIGMTLVDAFDLLTDMPDNPQRYYRNFADFAERRGKSRHSFHEISL